MVRITAVLSRVPVIKFRKGVGSSNAPSTAHPAAAGPGATGSQASVQAQPSAAMSSATISDLDLPLRYRRRPMSQEEIDHINGGGVV